MATFRLVSHINLLPWREDRRKEQQKEVAIIAGAVLAAALVIIGCVHFFYSQLIDRQNARLTYLDGQIKLVEKRIEEVKKLEEEKEKLLDRIRAIESLQKNRPLVVRLFDDLVNSVPEGVSLTRLKQTGSNIQIDGVAQSNARVSSFMRNISTSKWIDNPRLDVIEMTEEDDIEIGKFTLSFSQILPKLEEDE